jgi:hypothetical protein
MTRPRSQVLIYLDLLEATMGAILIVNTIDKKMLQFVVVVVLLVEILLGKPTESEGGLGSFCLLGFEF